MEPELPRIGESQMEEGWRLRPFTAAAIMLLAITVVAGLVATFVYASTPNDRWTYGIVSFAADVLAILVMAAVVRREERAPFPLVARKALWLSVVLLAFGAAALCVYAFDAPLPGFHPGVSLAVIAPGALIAWKLFRSKKG